MLGRRLSAWRSGLGIGFRTLLREPQLGAKRLVLPVSYWRTAEFAFVLDALKIPAGGTVLDLGSPKDLAVLLCRRDRCAVVAVDILEDAVRLSRRYAAAQGVDGEGVGRVESRVADGRALPFPDQGFDAAFSVSVLEHIPADGDTAAARELARILRPGGLLAITVPFAQAGHDTFRPSRNYEHDYEAGVEITDERHYDHDSLRSRLLDPTGLAVERREIWGEPSARWERFLRRSSLVRALLSPLEPVMNLLFLDQVPPDSGRAMAAFVLLRKPVSSRAA